MSVPSPLRASRTAAPKRRASRWQLVVCYLWASPNSLLGLCLALVGTAGGGGGRIRIHTGVLEAEGRVLRWLLEHATWLEHGVAAITFGHVVLGRDQHTLNWTRDHERVHVRQYERWGPLFIPLYLAAAVAAVSRGGDAYYDNAFEREAQSETSGNMP